MLYFAYGSNLHPTRLRERISEVALEGVGVVKGRRLAFHKRGFRDGSGKCDLPEASPSEHAYGALYRIAANQRLDLARIEGVGAGYGESRVEVETDGGQVSAFLFLAQPNFVDAGLVPVHWYKALVIEGARFHKFPENYVASIESMPSIADLDGDRAATNWALIEKIRRDNARLSEGNLGSQKLH